MVDINITLPSQQTIQTMKENDEHKLRILV